MVYEKTTSERRTERGRKKSKRIGMVSREAQLDEVFFALSHSARRRLLTRLGERGDQAVAAVAAPLAESPAQITKHLAILERAGLITRRIEGRQHQLHLEPDGIRLATDWISRHREFWNAGVDRLEQFLSSAQQDKP
jgi:DNA-binding transcriptional ArsR family regulator